MPFWIDEHAFPKSLFYKKRDIKINFIQIDIQHLLLNSVNGKLDL